MGNIGNLSGIGKMESGQGGPGDSFIKLTVDLTGITPTTETYKGKTYNKFTFTANELTISSISQLGDIETIEINDALIYNLLPMSNSNDDMGIHVEYSNNTFTGYVLSTMSTLTEVNFMFTYYIELTKTSILWENYTDMVLQLASQNKLYCVTISNKYTFYSSVPITNVNEFKSYLQDKHSVRVFGTAASYSASEYQIRTYTKITHLNSTNFMPAYHVMKIQFSNGAYTGGSETDVSENVSYTSISNYISCVEV